MPRHRSPLTSQQPLPFAGINVDFNEMIRALDHMNAAWRAAAISKDKLRAAFNAVRASHAHLSGK